METKNNAVDYLKKISVSMELGTTKESMDLSSDPITFQFIYGTGAQGICLFEKALFGMNPGQSVSLKIESTNLNDVFGHLTKSLKNILPDRSSFFLKTSIESIHQVEDRDIVHAIAAGTGGCDCGCGCE